MSVCRTNRRFISFLFLVQVIAQKSELNGDIGYHVRYVIIVNQLRVIILYFKNGANSLVLTIIIKKNTSKNCLVIFIFVSIYFVNIVNIFKIIIGS